MQTNEKLSFLLQAASWQDSLLQSYRLLQLTLQSVLLVIGIGLLVTVMFLNNSLLVVTSCLLFVIIWELQIFAKMSYSEIILSREEDINFWHRELISAETEIDASQRYFGSLGIAVIKPHMVV